MKLETEKGKLYRKNKLLDPYYKMFLSNTCLRESCYHCPSRGLTQRADITLSDFWGVENVSPDLVDEGGVSLVIIHTEKGEKVFNSIKEDCIGHTVNFNEAIKGNCSFFESYKRPLLRNSIEKDIEMLSFQKIVWKYAYSKREKIIKILKKISLYDYFKK